MRPSRGTALAMYGDLKYGPDFAHFDYANPDAPKGGSLALSAIGIFDSLNPFILRGTPAAGVALTFETLTTGSRSTSRSPNTACSPRPSRCRRTAPG